MSTKYRMVKRRKGKKIRDSPSEKRSKEKDGEVAIARGRFAGALKGILGKNIEDSDDVDTCSFNQSCSSKKAKRDTSPANGKKQNKGNDSEDHQSCVMKLLERSVDLAQFDAFTPLYPVCRSWILNKPILTKKKEVESGLVEIKHEFDEDSQMFELHEKTVQANFPEDNNVLSLPPPKPIPEGIVTFRIPSTIPHEIQEINLNPGPHQIPSREELLQSHLQKWTEVRKKWRAACFKNEERYAASKEILTKMFEKAQTQFQLPVN